MCSGQVILATVMLIRLCCYFKLSIVTFAFLNIKGAGGNKYLIILMTAIGQKRKLRYIAVMTEVV